jgi:Holliday junction resolvase RusA-like endonuclease
MPKTTILNITPQTFIRATQGDRVFFRIPRDVLRPAGLKRLKRLERYNEYKISLSSAAKSQGFILPEQGAHIIFYVPVSKSWRKHKKMSSHMELHQEKPDLDNYFKALMDSFFSEDKHIADVRLTKRWVNQERGWIEIIEQERQFRSNDTLT